ncbi:MAG: type II secretion system protein GspG [Candidatus Sumerlaeaceae bacterium]|nr:type II secretion system protein GspG [Candidatus Sumerlaeaceae bacterium]
MSRRQGRWARRSLVARRHGRNRGFTAIEIAMVATVIAIFALLVLPLFRNRVEEAKVAAAKADLTSLMKAEELVLADTGFLIRLEDLDNVEGLAADATGVAPAIYLSTPGFYYVPRAALYTGSRVVLNSTQRDDLAKKFRGPYIAFQKSITYGDLTTLASYASLANVLLVSRTGNVASPIYDVTGGSFPDATVNRIPLDPWGNPYLFYPSTAETAFNAIYSLGRDGLPGRLTGTTPADFLPGATNGLGTVGTDIDDLEVRF